MNSYSNRWLIFFSFLQSYPIEMVTVSRPRLASTSQSLSSEELSDDVPLSSDDELARLSSLRMTYIAKKSAALPAVHSSSKYYSL